MGKLKLTKRDKAKILLAVIGNHGAAASGGFRGIDIFLGIRGEKGRWNPGGCGEGRYNMGFCNKMN